MGISKGGDEEAQAENVSSVKDQHSASEEEVVSVGTFSRFAILIPRLAASSFSILALAFMVTAKQTKQVETMKVAASWLNAKAFLALAVLNAVCLCYSLLQTIVSFFSYSMWNGRNWCRIKALAWFTYSVDQVLTYALLAAASASAEVGYIAKRGQMSSGWVEVCTTFHSFCNRVGASLVLSFLSVLMLIISSLMSGFNATALHMVSKA